MRKRLMAMVLIVLAAAAVFLIGKSGLQIREKKVASEISLIGHEKDSIYIWYTDDAITPYISSAAVAYNEAHGTRIVPVLESGLNYVETINDSSVSSNVPDLYIISHDALQKAYLAGLAVEIEPSVNLQDSFHEVGLRAATYKDKVIGYPFYFETSALLYNESYLKDMAVTQLTQERATELAESQKESGEEQTQATEEDAFSDDQIAGRMAELLPDSIDDLRTFADSYDAPEQVESVFKWDVTDIFYNYFFVGSDIILGGECGWDTSKVDIYNLDAIESMKAYQNLNNFFSIDTSEISYKSTLEDFMQGKVVFTIATSDAVATLEQAKLDGTFAYDYGFLTTPATKEGENSRSLSMTNCVAVNGYSQNRDVANDFATFLCTEYNDILYDRTGKVSAARNVEYSNEALTVFAKEYETSVPLPKMIETGNYWVQMEAVFAEIWNGADANEKLKELSEKIKEQISGEQVEETYIEDEPDNEEMEYLDEEYYRQQALDGEE